MDKDFEKLFLEELIKLNSNFEKSEKNQELIIKFLEKSEPTEQELLDLKTQKEKESKENEDFKKELIKVLIDSRTEEIDYSKQLEEFDSKLSLIISNSQASEDSIKQGNIQESTNLAILYVLLFLLPFYLTIKWGSSFLDSAIA